MFYTKCENFDTPLEFFYNYFNTGTPDSYFDKDCENIQCRNGRRRSISDLYQIGLSRYPKLTELQLVSILLELVKLPTFKSQNKNYIFKGIVCKDVNKIVFKKLIFPSSKMFTCLEENPLLYDLRKYDIYNWEDDDEEYNNGWDQYDKSTHGDYERWNNYLEEYCEDKWTIEYLNKIVKQVLHGSKKEDRTVKEVQAES
mgnify:CR=1 FL=1